MVGEGEAKKINRELAIPMIHRAFEAGVNYIDTAQGYCNSDSQVVVGEALKGWRDKVIVSTKNHYYGIDEKEWWGALETSLKRLDVSCIDIYNHHGLRWARYEEFIAPVMSKWMQKAKDQGLIKHICCSFHDNNDALMKLVDSGYVSSITLQYNMLDTQLETGIAHAKERNIGVVVMGPVGGGRLGVPNEALAAVVPAIARIPELALRFVLANENATMALSGMSTMQQVEENLAVAADNVTLSEEEKTRIVEHLVRLKEMANLYCTGCNYCMPCPKEVAIPRVFGLYNQARVYGLWDHARKEYARLIAKAPKQGQPADKCVECGACEPKCPQNIPIREQLKEAHKGLLQPQ
jgi:predicted aldo/keto reductase-like oxidoreductase